MDAFELQDILLDSLQDKDPVESDPIKTIRSFADAGVMSNNAGLIIRTTDGSVFQLSIVRSR